MATYIGRDIALLATAIFTKIGLTGGGGASLHPLRAHTSTRSQVSFCMFLSLRFRGYPSPSVVPELWVLSRSRAPCSLDCRSTPGAAGAFDGRLGSEERSCQRS